MSESETLEIKPEQAGIRLDVCLAKLFPDRFSRSRVQKLIESKKILVNHSETTANYKIKSGDQVSIEDVRETDWKARAENIPLDILFEDESLLLINKPAGLVVHPAKGHFEHTLVNALLYHCTSFQKQSGSMRPGIVHRLDKDTSGVMVIAKNERVHAALAEQFKEHQIEKVYRTVVQGVVQHDEGMIEEPVGRAFKNRKKIIIRPSGGKEALTFFQVIKRLPNATFLEIRPRTGRTHQIRVHMNYMGHPIYGDYLYGVPSEWIDRQALHAFSLSFCHPATGKRCYGEAALPADMTHLIRRLETSA